MSEQIGNVILDDTFYPGEDLYCDGDVEDTILNIVKEYPETEYSRIIEEQRSWPVLYHLSHFRKNIVNWLPIDKSMKVLEVGSGCGAITGALAKKAGSVTCVDLSRKRSMINAYRHKDYDNITIKMGNFKDIEPTLDTDYDYVFLIGVFEYGQGYMGSKTPYHDFMNIIKKHCDKDGRIVIAIENKYGLKYFAGCMEDHVGKYFTGIEDYPAGGGVRTFSRNGLIRIMEECGINDYHFYYPYPDYKFVTAVYSDEYLPRVGELTNNMRNFDKERMLLFDEKNTFDGLIRDGMFQEFSNSFLVVIGNKPEPLYAKFSNDRKPEYAISTTIGRDVLGTLYVEKRADMPQAGQHVASLTDKYEQLLKKYEGCPLTINRCKKTAEAVRFEYLQGKTLEEKLDACLYGNDREGFMKLLSVYREIADYHEEMEISDFDLIFSNILIDEADRWSLIDYEWTYPRAMSGAKMAKRAVFIYMMGPEIRRRWLFEQNIAQEFGITEECLDELLSEETRFQHEVTGLRLSMYELYDRMGQPVLARENCARKKEEPAATRRFQVYEDHGEGFSEERSKFFEEAFREDHEIRLRYFFSGENKKLRLDPAMEPCMLYRMELSVNGEQLNIESIETNGYFLPGGSYVFTTQDPNLTVDLAELELSEENELFFKAEVEWLPAETVCACPDISAKYPIRGNEKGRKHRFFGRR